MQPAPCRFFVGSAEEWGRKRNLGIGDERFNPNPVWCKYSNELYDIVFDQYDG
jgi:hypothetical protein